MEQASGLDNLIPEGIGSENTSKSMGFIMKLTLIIVIFMFKNPSESPYILDGMLSGIENKTVTQNPGLTDSITIFRSRNQASGMEFTWSTWLFVNSDGNFDSTNYNQWKHIFHKGPVDNILSSTCSEMEGGERCTRVTNEFPWSGNAVNYNYENVNLNTTNSQAQSSILSYGDGLLYSPDYLYGYQEGMAFAINSPGLYLSKETNKLRFIMSTIAHEEIYDNSVGGNHDTKLFESIDISNIPLDKWFCLVIRGKNNVLDAYVNGVIHTRHYVEHVMKQTYYDLHFGLNNGWNGYISSLKYHNKGISAVEIK